MSNQISTKKVRRIVAGLLKWRSALPKYNGGVQSEFSNGYETFSKDLLEELHKIEDAGSQRKIWNKSRYLDSVEQEQSKGRW